MSFGGWVGSKANSFVYSLWSTFFLVIGAILLFIGGTASSSGEGWAIFACLGSPLCFIVAIWAWVKSKYHASVVPTVGGMGQQIVYVQQPMRQQMQYQQPVQYQQPTQYQQPVQYKKPAGKKCGACGTMNSASNRFCGNCGGPI